MRWAAGILLVVVMLGFPANVKADVAPPAQPPGANPQPGVEGTSVRMMAETVTIDILANTPSGSLGAANVTANFTMRNLGVQAETMAARFPVSSSDGFGGFPEITDMRIKVNGVSTAIRKIMGEDPNGWSDSVPWIEFDVSFPPGEDVIIQAAYTLKAHGEMPFVWFNYVFSTGAGWSGTIGSATLYVRFPYEISELNVLPNPANPEKVIFPEHQLSGTELKWSFTDFEPQTGDNFVIEIAAPSVWEKVLKERQILTNNRADGEAWGRLAKLYKQLSFSSRGRGFRSAYISTDTGARFLYNMSVESYANAVLHKAKDALWHAGFADLLAYYSYWAGLEGIDTRAEAVRAMQEMRSALWLGPDNPKVKEIADEILFYLEGGMVKKGDGYDYPWLTATPRLSPTAAAATVTATPKDAAPERTTQFPPETTPQFMATSGIAPTTTPRKGLPVCGSVLLIPLGLWFVAQRRR